MFAILYALFLTITVVAVAAVCVSVSKVEDEKNFFTPAASRK